MSAYIDSHLATRECFNDLYFGVYLLPNFKEDQSIVVMKISHGVTDGMGANILLAKLLNGGSLNMVGAFKKVTFYEKF